MKIKNVLIPVLIAVCSVFSVAQAETLVPRVTVVGFAKKEVVPNEMNWNLQVQHKDKDLENLASKHAAATSEINQLLKQLAIKENKLKTSQMSFSENWEYLNESRIRLGYVASTNISFILSDFSKYLSIWQKLSQFPEVSVNGVNFSHSEIEKIQDELKTEALLDAKKKALSMAATLRVRLGSVIYIGDNAEPSVQPQFFESRSMSAMKADSGSPVEPGSMEVRSEVRVDFRIEGE